MFNIVHVLLIESSLVNLRVGLELHRVHNTFAVHQLILFGLLLCLNGVILCLTHNMVGIVYSGLTSFGQRFLNVMCDVLFEHRKVQLFTSFADERDSPYFTFPFTLLGLAPVVLWTARGKFDNRVTFIELVLEIAEIITKL